jgi:hypothetical protein
MRPHPVEVLRVDVGGKVFESYRPIGARHAPEAMCALVQCDLVGIDVPGPQGDAGRVGGNLQAIGIPHRRRGAFPWHRAISLRAMRINGAKYVSPS